MLEKWVISSLFIILLCETANKSLNMSRVLKSCCWLGAAEIPGTERILKTQHAREAGCRWPAMPVTSSKSTVCLPFLAYNIDFVMGLTSYSYLGIKLIKSVLLQLISICDFLLYTELIPFSHLAISIFPTPENQRQ